MTKVHWEICKKVVVSNKSNKMNVSERDLNDFVSKYSSGNLLLNLNNFYEIFFVKIWDSAIFYAFITAFEYTFENWNKSVNIYHTV